MKKIISLLLVGLLLLNFGTVLAEDVVGAGGTNTIQWEDIGVQADTTVVVGTTTAMSGRFGTDFFGSNATDMDIRSLIQGYSTVAFTDTMTFNGTAIENVEMGDAQGGGQKYIFTLSPSLVYNDGTQMTAKDYVFSVLLSNSRFIEEIGGTPRSMSHLVGYQAYREGTADHFAGVRLLSDYSFSLEISSESLPFFYGLAMLAVTPYPLHILAPGCDVYDDGQGAYLAPAADASQGGQNASGYTPGVFSADMLRTTLLDPVQGYVFNPRVTSGPYQLGQYDQHTNTVFLTRNERFLGNYEGQKPHVGRVAYTLVHNDTMLEDLQTGKVDILARVMGVDAAQEGMSLAFSGNFQWLSYPRSGFAFLAFACEESATSSANVRNAIARSFDRQALVDEVGKGWAGVVNGYYGIGQWMMLYDFSEDANGAGETLRINEVVEELAFQPDVEAAIALLVQDGWVLNAAGQPFVQGVDAVRYKEENGALVPLEIRWAKTADSDTADVIHAMLTEPFQQMGIAFEVTEMPFEEMLKYYYRDNARTYNMFYLASNFEYVFDPYYDFHTSDAMQGHTNRTGLRSESLMELAWKMRATPSDNPLQYAKNWIEFQKHWLELMPMVPLFSNTYFDFFANDIQGYDPTNHAGVALAMPYVYVGEPVTVSNQDGQETGDVGLFQP